MSRLKNTQAQAAPQATEGQQPPVVNAGFGLEQAEQPAQAIVRLNLAKPENVDRFGGRIWHGQRGDGSWCFLGGVSQTVNIKYRGMSLTDDMLADVGVEVRVNGEEMEELLEALDDIETRVADVHIRLKAEPVFKRLTLKDGSTSNSTVFFATIIGVRQAEVTLQGDDFESKDDLMTFLAENRQKRQERREDYRASLDASNESTDDIG
jgi:hypothetical protein